MQLDLAKGLKSYNKVFELKGKLWQVIHKQGNKIWAVQISKKKGIPSGIVETFNLTPQEELAPQELFRIFTE